MVRMILIGAALVVMAVIALVEFRNSLDPDSMGFFGEESV